MKSFHHERHSAKDGDSYDKDDDKYPYDDDDDGDSYGDVDEIQETNIETAEWYLTDKDNTFTGAYNTPTMQATPPSWKQKRRGKTTDHYKTTDAHNHEDSHTATSGEIATRKNGSITKENKTRRIGAGTSATPVILPPRVQKERGEITQYFKPTGSCDHEKRTKRTKETVEWHLTGKDNTFAGTYDIRAPSMTPSQQMQKEKNPRTDSWDALMEEHIKAPSLFPIAAVGTQEFLLEEYIILYNRKKELV